MGPWSWYDLILILGMESALPVFGWHIYGVGETVVSNVEGWKRGGRW